MSQRYLGGIITANPTTPTLTTESGVWTLEQQLQYSSVWSPNIIGNSLRFRSSANAYLNRTNSSSPTNAIKWTWSGWVKRGSLGAQQNLVGATNSGSDDTYFQFNSSDQIVLGSYTGAGTDYGIRTSAVFRDPSAWYHIVAVLDTANATSADRAILYVNGVRQAVTNAASGMWPQNATNNKINTASQVVNIGRRSLGDSYLDGYLTEINFVDGQALTPFSFGAYDSTGVWQPLLYTGTYGTNGYYLTFADNSGTTATTLGKDYSGNGNNWTPNNFSLTAGTTYDWMLDSPTNWSNGTGNGQGNYPVLNPLYRGYGGYTATPLTFSNANLSVTGNASANNAAATMALPSSGKFYWEYVWTAAAGGEMDGGIIGVAGLPYFYRYDGTYYNGSTYVSYGASYTTNDVIGVAIDMDNLTFTFYKNGVSQGTKTSAFPSGGTYFPWVYCSNTVGASINFGQRPFAYTPPTGYVALNTNNLPNPNINNGANYMAATTYTGNGSTQSISNGGNNPTGVTFKPDFVWIKNRSGANSHQLTDSVRGVTKYLFSDATLAEETRTNQVTTITSTGFSLDSGAAVNTSSNSFIGWQWQAGAGTTSSNTSGSITSTVSVNATAGFSVVAYNSGASGDKTVGHGLGVAPSMIITKSRSSASYNWSIYHASVATTVKKYLTFTTDALQDNGSNIWGSAFPTSSVFGITSGNGVVASTDCIAYCFSAVAGYSAFGSYTGNNSSDGPFVYTGFRPRWILFKDSTNAATNWVLQDTSRFTYNVATGGLLANTSASEYSTGYDVDILSNGFKIRRSGGDTNQSGATIIYAAFAENPFKIARAR